jgi:hypothetical protein
MKGTCVHFPQCVEELHEQLPLHIKDSQMIVVCESLQGLSKTKEFNVRPKYIREALNWLIKNNRLYHDVKIVEREDGELDVNKICVAINELGKDQLISSSPYVGSQRSTTSGTLRLNILKGKVVNYNVIYKKNSLF